MPLEKNFFLLNFQKNLLFFLPLALITGPFLPDLIISLCGTLFIICMIVEKKIIYIKNKYFIFFLFYCLYLILLSLFKADNISLSLESSLFYFRFGFFVLSVIYVLSRIPTFQNIFLYFFYITYLIVLLDSILQFFLGINTIGLIIMAIYNDFNIVNYYGFSYTGIFPNNRLSSFFGKELILGSYLSRLFPFFLLFLSNTYNEQKLLNKFILMIVFLLSFVIVFLSGERSAFFNMIVYLFIFLFILKFDNFFKFTSVLLIILSITASSLLYKDTFNRMISKTISQIYPYSIKKDVENKITIFSIQHQVVYNSAFRMFRDNIMFGVGPKMFRQKCKEERYQVLVDVDSSVNGCQTHPHNTYIQLLSETGLLGVLPVSVIFLYLFYFIFIKSFFFKNFLKINTSNSSIILMSALLISLWPIIPTGNFFNNWLSIIYFLPIGFLLNNEKKYL
jgi:O-antigen ligase